MYQEKEVVACYEQMAIVEKYETVIAYLYPVAQSLPRRHGVAREMFLMCLLGQVQLFVEAGKSGQVSRLYRFIHFELGAVVWARYMDDIVILSRNPYELREWFGRIESYSTQRLGLAVSRWQVSPVSQGINFLGFRIWPRHKLLRKQSVVRTQRAKRAIARCVRHADQPGLERFVAAWRGHARHADTCNLFNNLESRHGIRLHQLAH